MLRYSRSIVTGGVKQYFNPNAFLVPVAGTYGNVGRDVLIGPGVGTLDFSVLKNTFITERTNLQFRAEFFNVLNRANLATPNPVVFAAGSAATVSTAGVISATSTTSRQIQFGLKLLW